MGSLVHDYIQEKAERVARLAQSLVDIYINLVRIEVADRSPYRNIISALILLEIQAGKAIDVHIGGTGGEGGGECAADRGDVVLGSAIGGVGTGEGEVDDIDVAESGLHHQPDHRQGLYVVGL